jgi:hypothetical protein
MPDKDRGHGAMPRNAPRISRSIDVMSAACTHVTHARRRRPGSAPGPAA